MGILKPFCQFYFICALFKMFALLVELCWHSVRMHLFPRGVLIGQPQVSLATLVRGMLLNVPWLVS